MVLEFEFMPNSNKKANSRDHERPTTTLIIKSFVKMTEGAYVHARMNYNFAKVVVSNKL